ncbi:MAG: hypothetical protein A2234_03215 [Elusimicrobia bacterium RIFOXYA2_FULL_58_8]|nr:MAG: hypothetical protein A2285_02570 [Elusimicrobia bacterium RIFOXYA12_FULL_57_11]OGS17261.1 MAG: hypothetical protein A2234_03215 [Elusimicrobia bacterium RIFOXYA2_FULL_58_8]
MRAAPGRATVRALKITAAMLAAGLCSCTLQEGSEIAPYLNFIERNKRHSVPVTTAAFQESFQAASEFLKKNPHGKVVKDLRGRIIRELHIAFLLNALDSRELTVKTLYSRTHSGYTEKKISLTDPQAGEFFALLLFPDKAAAQYPAIVGLHGHGGAPDTGIGIAMAREGFAVALIYFRAMNGGRAEKTSTEKLYANGFTLMGLRVYETLLLVKYLKSAGFIDPGRIGIMGHSGGTSVARLVSWLNPGFYAAAYDMRVSFLRRFEDRPEGVHCETIPALAYYDPQINDLAALPFYAREFRYGYAGPGEQRELVRFFKDNLAQSVPPGERRFRSLSLSGISPVEPPAASPFTAALVAYLEAAVGKVKAALKRAAGAKESAGERGLHSEVAGPAANSPEVRAERCFILAGGSNKELALGACQSAVYEAYSGKGKISPASRMRASAASFESYKLLKALERGEEAYETLLWTVKNAPSAWPGLPAAEAALEDTVLTGPARVTGVSSGAINGGI